MICTMVLIRDLWSTMLSIRDLMRLWMAILVLLQNGILVQNNWMPMLHKKDLLMNYRMGHEKVVPMLWLRFLRSLAMSRWWILQLMLLQVALHRWWILQMLLQVALGRRWILQRWILQMLLQVALGRRWLLHVVLLQAILRWCQGRNLRPGLPYYIHLLLQDHGVPYIHLLDHGRPCIHPLLQRSVLVQQKIRSSFQNQRLRDEGQDPAWQEEPTRQGTKTTSRTRKSCCWHKVKTTSYHLSSSDETGMEKMDKTRLQTS